METNQYKAMFEAAFKLREPWKLAGLMIDENKKRLEVKLQYIDSGEQKCPLCGNYVIDMFYLLEKSWLHLNFFQFDTHMTVNIPIFKCINVKCVGHNGRDVIINSLFLDILLMLSPCDRSYALGILLASHREKISQRTCYV